MRITPLDIRKHHFKVTFRGWDRVEVQSFLQAVAEEFETVVLENQKLGNRVEVMEGQLREHMERERILKDTLMSAQAAADGIRSDACKEAELLIKQAELRGEKLVSQASDQVLRLNREIDELRRLRDSLKQKLRFFLDEQEKLLDYWEQTDRVDAKLAVFQRASKRKTQQPS